MSHVTVESMRFEAGDVATRAVFTYEGTTAAFDPEEMWGALEEFEGTERIRLHFTVEVLR